MGAVVDEGDDDGGGGGGVKNKGSVDKLLKFKLSLLDGGSKEDDDDAGNGVIPLVLPTIVGSVDVFELVPVVVVVRVFPHIEDNTKAAATVCSWL